MSYDQLLIENLITFDFSSVAKNFKTIDSFMKNFTNFQRKVTDIQKSQKAIIQDLSNFKMSTTNTFSTMNEILDSRNQIVKGNNKGSEQELGQIKKTIKQLKVFVTQSTRQVNNTLQLKDKDTQQMHKQNQTKFNQLFNYKSLDKLRFQNIQTEMFSFKSKYSNRLDTQKIKNDILSTKQVIEKSNQQIKNMKQLLSTLGVKQFKLTLDQMKQNLDEQLQNMKNKLKVKIDLTDTLKLQQMLLNTINFSYQNLIKKLACKNQTKKALTFLEKKINMLIQTIFNQENDKDGLAAVKTWKCISCSKDLGQFEGKLDKFKSWSVFPAKQSKNKQKYNGFGQGFQSIVETAVTKKGGQIGYDQKGRMVTPFNLTREVHNTKNNHSQNKGNQSKNSPSKPSQSNYMSLFGRNNQIDIDIKFQYLQRQRGLLSNLKKDT